MAMFVVLVLLVNMAAIVLVNMAAIVLVVMPVIVLVILVFITSENFTHKPPWPATQ